MSDEIDISTDMIDLVVMQEDGSLRVDMVLVENSPKVHYAPMFRIYSSDDPVHKKLLELTDINKPGDAYSFSLEREKKDKVE
ncbi:MAG: hypothetical protein K8F91_00425 [Candidatus Obscuribacterales bacterium]|nr:hypothetical protein [Candidatus Obscuribacterales bacterium]